MVQSGQISVIIAIFHMASVTLGQLDHFLPPPPSRLGGRRRPYAPQTPVKSGNPYLSRAYGGTWFRANFQDLFSYRGAQKLEWFEVLEETPFCQRPTVEHGSEVISKISFPTEVLKNLNGLKY